MDQETKRALNKSTVLGVISAKGGTGKTTLAISIGHVLSKIGFKVLLIDMDAATNGLTLFFLNQVTQPREPGSRGIIEPDRDGPTSVVNIAENLDLVPATFSFSDTSTVTLEQASDSLSSLLGRVRDLYDYIIIDAEPGSDPLPRLAAGLADLVIIVTEYDPMSRVAIARLERLFSMVLKPEATFYLANKVLPETASALRKEVNEQFFSIFRVLPAVPFDFKVMEAYSFRRTPVNLEEPGVFETALIHILERLFPEAVRQVEKFRTIWKEAQRIPMNKRIDELEKTLEERRRDLDGLNRTLRRRMSRSLSIKLAFNVAIATVVMTLAAVVLIYPGLAAFRLDPLQIVILAGSLPVVAAYVIWLRGRLTSRYQTSHIRQRIREIQYEIQLLLEERRKYETLSELQDLT